MFSRFAAALYSAVDAIAPPLPLEEDFVWHWKSATKFLTAKNAPNKVPVEMTSIPTHLFQMLTILEQEGNELEAGNIGPCMEYIMQHKVLDCMIVLAESDTPPGMRRYMYIFISRMLSITPQFLIPHASIYIPVQNLIQLCGAVQAAPTEKEEMDFLEVVCSKLKENPHLVNCFMGPFTERPRRSSFHSKSECEIANASAAKNDEECSVISALLRLFQSPDNSVSQRARNGLKLCCTLANDASAFVIIQSTDLSHVICSYIASIYSSLSKKLKLNEIENIFSLSSSDDASSLGLDAEQRKYICYLQFLNFIDEIVKESHPLISDSLCSAFHAYFLSTCIYFDLVTNVNPDDHIFVTNLVSSSIRHISALKLMSAFGLFLLGDTDDFEIAEHTSHKVKDTLIDRCRQSNKNLALSMASLQLFEELLQNPTENILHNLVLSNLIGRGYYDNSAVDSWIYESDDEDRYSDKLDEDLPQKSTPISKTFAPSYTHRILDCFLSLIPDDIKSCESEEESGYEIYVKEARGRFINCVLLCENFDWPQEPISSEEYHGMYEDDSSSDSQPEADSTPKNFYEGTFLSMIFDKIEHMLVQPYDINLQVTSIISRLALFPHPNLHEYLLNPLIPYTCGTRSLFTVLVKLVEDIQREVQKIKGYKPKLLLTRKALLSEGNECPPYEESNLLEVIIVVEEFCKELAAITFVKYHAAS